MESLFIPISDNLEEFKYQFKGLTLYASCEHAEGLNLTDVGCNRTTGAGLF